MDRVLGVIPARFASTRFPGKLLAPLGDGTLIEQVWRRMSAARAIDRVIVATDDRRIAEAARGFGAEVQMTSAAHRSGTDRIAEVVRALPAAEAPGVVVNVQGDEPLVSPHSLDRLVEQLERDPDCQLATLAEPLEDRDALFDPNVVKVVTATGGRALYFSRAPIPYHRGDRATLEPDFRRALAERAGGLAGYRKHQGVYAYRREALLRLAALPPSPLELDEGLEQLRALEAGFSVTVVDSDFRSLGVDTPADLERVSRLLTEAH
jgi:3-deoxy-manno-octulosonate cytidylyltransferase (CMP-KDO synthetase)